MKKDTAEWIYDPFKYLFYIAVGDYVVIAKRIKMMKETVRDSMGNPHEVGVPQPDGDPFIAFYSRRKIEGKISLGSECSVAGGISIETAQSIEAELRAARKIIAEL